MGNYTESSNKPKENLMSFEQEDYKFGATTSIRLLQKENSKQLPEQNWPIS